MKKYLVSVSLMAVAAIPPSILAQEGVRLRKGGGATVIQAASSADEAWDRLNELENPKPSRGSMPSVALNEELTVADRYFEASQAARAFYDRFPGDRRAAQARKMEAMLALQASQADASRYKDPARVIAAKFRADKRNSDADRYDVAFLMDAMNLTEALRGKRLIDDGEKYEQLADGLRAELGDTPEIFGLYVSIVRTTDMQTATRVASRLLADKKAPEWAREQAGSALARSALVGKPLALKLTTIGGSTLDLSRQHDRPTVLYFWHAAGGPNELAVLDQFKPSFKTDARWIYICLGAAPPVSDQSMRGSPFADSHCYESAQTGSPSVNYLKVPRTPFAFVLKGSAEVVGYGFPENIAGLLEKAGK